MPSYRYTREIQQEDLQPDKPPELTGKAKRKNWWHYHWKILVVILVVAALVVSFVVEMLRKSDPDVTLGILSPSTLPTALTVKLDEELATLLSQSLGAETTAATELYTIYMNAEDEDATGGEYSEEDFAGMETGYELDYYAQMAGVTQLSGTFSDSKVMLFLLYEDMAADYLAAYDMLMPLPFADGALYLNWADVPALAGLDLGFEAYEGYEHDGQLILADFVIGVRDLAGSRFETKEDALANQAGALALLEEWYTA